MGIAAGRKAGKHFDQQRGAYALAAILWRYGQILDEGAGPALDKSGHAAISGNCGEAEGRIEFAIRDEVAMPVREGRDEAGEAQLQHMMGVAGINICKCGGPISLRPDGRGQRAVQRLAQAQMRRLVAQGYSAAAATKPPCFSMKPMI